MSITSNLVESMCESVFQLNGRHPVRRAIIAWDDSLAGIELHDAALAAMEYFETMAVHALVKKRPTFHFLGFNYTLGSILEWNSVAKIDAILLFPPKELQQDIDWFMAATRIHQHTTHPRPHIVGLMNSEFESHPDAKAREFREWLNTESPKFAITPAYYGNEQLRRVILSM